MLTLTLEYGVNKTIDLNSLLGHEEGVQAIAGLTGTGLPPVSVQWSEGAGDGATYRGRRVLARPIDLPLYYATKSRRNLKALARELAIALSGECVLRMEDTEENFAWYATVVRTGGGDFVYGDDTDGSTYLSLIVTLQAGNPFWLHDRTVKVTQAGADFGPTVSIDNPGTANAYPVWTVTGPGIGLKITSPAGEQIVYNDLIDLGDTLIINTATGKVVDGDGTNRYPGTGGAPRMFTLPPGRSDIAVEIDQTSDVFIGAQTSGRTNFVTNPMLRTNATGWTLDYDATYDAIFKWITVASQDMLVSDLAIPTFAKTTVSGLVPGNTYRAVLSGKAGAVPAAASGHVYSSHGDMNLTLTNGSQILSTTLKPSARGTLDVTFVAEGPTATLSASSGLTAYRLSSGGGIASFKLDQAWAFGPAFIGEPGAIFDGSYADADGIEYAWTGTADASTSKAVQTLGPDELAQVSITCELTPRDWMVV